MPPFRPEELLRVLERHGVRYVIIGGLGATLHGSPLPTRDTDVCPAGDDANLQALASALQEVGARIRVGEAPDGLPFTCDAHFLAQVRLLNLTTRYGDLHIAFEPAGTSGYAELAERAVRYDLGDGLVVPVAALEDIVRSKESAGRDKDRLSLPTLKLLLEKRGTAGDR